MREEVKKMRPGALLINAAAGSVIAMVLCLAAMAIFAIVISAGKLSGDLMEIITVVTIFVCSMIGSVFAVKKQKGKTLLTGVAQGAILFLITVVIGAFMPGTTFVGSLTAPIATSAILGAVVMSFFMARKRKVKI